MEQIVDAFRKENMILKPTALVALCSMPGSSKKSGVCHRATCRQKLNELHFYNTGKYLDGLYLLSNMASNKGIHFVDVEASLETFCNWMMWT